MKETFIYITVFEHVQVPMLAARALKLGSLEPEFIELRLAKLIHLNYLVFVSYYLVYKETLWFSL